jgi:hypothetical protein
VKEAAMLAQIIDATASLRPLARIAIALLLLSAIGILAARNGELPWQKSHRPKGL